MKQKQKQQLVNNQINQIRKSIKALKALNEQGLYLDPTQRYALYCIAERDLMPLSI